MATLMRNRMTTVTTIRTVIPMAIRTTNPTVIPMAIRTTNPTAMDIATIMDMTTTTAMHMRRRLLHLL